MSQQFNLRIVLYVANVRRSSNMQLKDPVIVPLSAELHQIVEQAQALEFIWNYNFGAVSELMVCKFMAENHWKLGEHG